MTTHGTWRRRRRRSGSAGFTLLEALVAVTLMGMILYALGAVTAQWLPGWNRGFMRVQRGELFSVAVNRLASDLAAAEFVTANRDTKLPIFEGGPTAVMLVRSAIGPNTEPGLEVVRIAEGKDRQGIALVRSRTPFAPFGSGDVSPGQLAFTDPVVLLRAPFRVTFSYLDGDGKWQDTWQDADKLPVAVRFLIRDTTNGRTLAISSAAMVHVDTRGGCASSQGAPSPAAGNNAQAPAASSPQVPPVLAASATGSQGCGGAATPGAPANTGPAAGVQGG